VHQQTLRSDEEMFHDAYVQELTDFVDVVRTNGVPPVTGQDARNALQVALAAMASYEEHRPVRI
jgi:myo-inositol 2-dehydrogenase / D-chiro-inositol 1-dehydrogenase